MCIRIPRGLMGTRFAGPTPKVSASGGPGWGLIICISVRFPSEQMLLGTVGLEQEELASFLKRAR